jgi:mono/diheme cytochrome c family protein
MVKVVGALIVLFCFMVACTKQRPADSPSAETPQGLIPRGKSVYQTACTACHHSNPALDGAVGPAVNGASVELLERRILYGDYPVGYTPKRKSHLMVPLPHLKNDIPALAAFLQSVKKD